ncbi:MAG: serine--tRNA ligase [Gemmatimonadota bacterium]|jgi:seryl-tRNA synthetase|nr:serine--tRNA ligase [Gemmatimonadota bacterium]
MHDLKLLRERPDALAAGMARRGKGDVHAPALARAAALEAERRRLIVAADERKAARNAVTAEVAALKKARQDAEAPMARSRALGEEIAALEAELAALEAALGDLLLGLPNLVVDEVPAGDETANAVVKSWGTPRPADEAHPHWVIAETLGLLDLPRGAKVAGSGFVAFRGVGARLVRGLMQFMLDLHTREHGYEEVWVPFVVNRQAMIGTGQLPKFEDDMYAVPGEGLFLAPTAEVPVTNLHRDELIDAGDLPRALCAYTPCFRREAGAAGKDTRGLLRLHQFDKVELVRYETPETARAALEALTRHAETVLERLELPYRRVLLAAGDTGFASAMTWDLEVWSPGTNKWLEVSSCSWYTDFQARRMNLRYRPAPGEKPRFVHTLNGSGLAFPRTIAALLEHHRQPDGRVRVPDALRSYLGADHLG